jgi:hypothetical protein
MSSQGTSGGENVAELAIGKVVGTMQRFLFRKGTSDSRRTAPAPMD